MKKVSLFITDDDETFLGLMQKYLSHSTYRDLLFEVSGTARNGEEVLLNSAYTYCDVLLLDLGMPKMSGIDLLNELKNQKVRIKILVNSGYSDRSIILKCKYLGAKGFIDRTSGIDLMIKAILSIYTGNTFFPDSINKTKNHDYNENKFTGLEIKEICHVLTKRELEIFLLYSAGYGCSQIAGKICRTVKCVENHRANILSKLNFDNTEEMRFAAIRFKQLYKKNFSSAGSKCVYPG